MFAVTRKQKEKHIQSLEASVRHHSQWGDVFRRLFRNKLAVIGLVLVIVIVFSAIFANLLTPYDYSVQDLSNRLQFPS